jgi:hypothetical protein
MECYYAESCGFTSVTCDVCGTDYDIELKFGLKRKVKEK